LPRSSIQILIAFFASVVFVHESDIISGGPGGFHCSSIGSIVEVVMLGIVEKVMVLILGEAEVNIVLVNNASRDGRVLKFVLVTQAILKY
jgi:hypothetical protein